MKRSLITTLTLSIATGALIVASSMSAANPRNPAATPSIDRTQAHQQARINKGVAKGKITPAEQANLQQGQASIANAKAIAKSDGVVTKAERKQIKGMQAVESRKIYRKKHNARAL